MCPGCCIRRTQAVFKLLQGGALQGAVGGLSCGHRAARGALVTWGQRVGRRDSPLPAPSEPPRGGALLEDPSPGLQDPGSGSGWHRACGRCAPVKAPAGCRGRRCRSVFGGEAEAGGARVSPEHGAASGRVHVLLLTATSVPAGGTGRGRGQAGSARPQPGQRLSRPPGLSSLRPSLPPSLLQPRALQGWLVTSRDMGHPSAGAWVPGGKQSRSRLIPLPGARAGAPEPLSLAHVLDLSLALVAP